jgi:Flp pilus assembly protein TadG
MKNEIRKMRRKCFAKLRIGERGQSLVETALVVPILVTLLVGTVEMGRVVYASIAVANAAKAGAQYGCENGFTAQDSSGIALAASDEVPTMTVTTTSSSACACSDGSASTCLNTDCANSHLEQTLTVNTSATVSANIRLPGLPTSYTVKGQSIQRVVQ